MRTSRIGWIALILWLVTIAVAAWFFVRGNTAPGTDGRTAIIVAPSERDFVMAEMRGLLSATQKILDATTRDDRQGIAEAARAAGMNAASEASPAMVAKLPLEFKKLGMSVHADMDALADAADKGASTLDLQRMLVQAMDKCVACHAEWRLRAEGPTS